MFSVFLPGADFFEAVLLLAVAGNRISGNLWKDFRRDVREFLGVVLELALGFPGHFQPMATGFLHK